MSDSSNSHGKPIAVASPAGIPAPSLTHTAKYSIKASELARLLGIRIPAGASIETEHVSPDTGRTTSIGRDHTLVIRINWEDEG